MKDHAGETPLHKAVRSGNVKAVQVLAEASYLDATNNEGMAPLHWACLLGYDEIAKALVEAGADPHLTDDLLDDMTPLDLAILMGYEDIEESIRADAKARRGGDPAAANRLLDSIASMNPEHARPIASAFTVYFDLVNLAEELVDTSRLIQQTNEAHPHPPDESIGGAIAALKKRGLTSSDMARLLETLSIELVLTAHPTEARRRTIHSHSQRIGLLLRQSMEKTLPQSERERILSALHSQIVLLWMTDRARTVKPAVTDEVRTGLYFVDTTLWEVIPRLYEDWTKLYPNITRNLSAIGPGCAWLRG